MTENDQNSGSKSENKLTIPILRVIQGNEKGAVKHINKKRFLVGRKVGDMVLTDTKISGTHFAIEIHNSETVLIDLDSTNGTTLNGKKVHMSPINNGDEIEIGTSILKFSYEEITQSELNSDNWKEADTGKHTLELESYKSPDSGRINNTERFDSISTIMGEPSKKSVNYKLRIFSGPNDGDVYKLIKERTVLGRISADINFNDSELLRKHAMIEIAHNGITIRDLSNEEGLYINDRRVMTCRLKGGEKIQIGKTIMEFTIEEE